MKSLLRSPWALVLLLGVFTVALGGCAESVSEEGQPVKEGDYMTEPGKANQAPN